MKPASVAVVLAALAVPAAPPAAGAQTYLVVVSGLGGDPQFSTLFYQWGRTLVDAASRLGLPDSQVTFLAEQPARDSLRIDGPATRDDITRSLGALAARVPPEAVLVLVLLGHGSDRGSPRLSLPGPDLSAGELGQVLSAFPTQRVAVINTASASGGFVPALSARRRVVITATKSGFEQNHATFGGHFVEAFTGTAADADKNERVSLLEAFQYARQAVRRAYEADQRLLTEHALLDDNGDGVGSETPGETAGDGVLAASVFLAPAVPALAAAGDPELQTLLARKASLEGRIAELRARRASLSTDEYDRQLEALLVDLAEVDQRIRERGSGRRP